VLLLKLQCLGYGLRRVSRFSVVAELEGTYISKGRKLRETDIFVFADEGLLYRGKTISFQGPTAFGGVYKDAGLCEMRFVAGVEVSVGSTQVVEVVGSFGAFRIW
jgi:hypothetical protein